MKTLILLLCAATTSTAEMDLMELIRAGDIAQLKNALKSGANPNSKDEKGVTALMYAAAYSAGEGLEALLEAGADVNQASDAGSTPLMTAIADPVKVRMLVNRGANVNATAASGNTPLVRALQLPIRRRYRSLPVEKGAKPNAPGSGFGPSDRRIDLARKFLEAGVVPDPLAVAASLNSGGCRTAAHAT